MRLHLRDIKAFSQCPAYYHFTRGDQVLVPRRRAVTESVIKKCYIQATETGYRTNWRSVVGWVDAEVFRDVNIEKDESFRAAKVLSEHILLSVQKWYDEIYLHESYENFIDMDIYKNVGSDVVTATIPVVQAAEPIILTIFQDLGITRLELYNDLEVRGLAWMLASSLDDSGIQVRSISVGPRGGLELVEFPVGKLDHERIEDTTKQVLKGIHKGFCYPSRTEQCKHCKYVRRCRL